MEEFLHNMKAVSIRTGLSPHTIRAWERRHSALLPGRSGSGRRLYSEEEIEKLTLMKHARELGMGLVGISALTVPELRVLLLTPKPALPEPTVTAEEFIAVCMADVVRLDGPALERALERATSDLGAAVMLERVALPLLHEMGEAWRDGRLRPAQEHMGVAALRTQLGRLLNAARPAAGAPCIVATTPAGQVHEMGALAAAITAAFGGWRAVYLGPDLPAEEIAGAVRQTGARALVIGIAYPSDDVRLPDDLKALRRQVGPEVAIFVGGRGAGAYGAALASINATAVEDLPALRAALEALRQGPAPDGR